MLSFGRAGRRSETASARRRDERTDRRSRRRLDPRTWGSVGRASVTASQAKDDSTSAARICGAPRARRRDRRGEGQRAKPAARDRYARVLRWHEAAAGPGAHETRNEQARARERQRWDADGGRAERPEVQAREQPGAERDRGEPLGIDPGLGAER